MTRSPMTSSLNWPPHGAEKIAARAADLIAEEMSLRDLRRALGKTQAKVAGGLRRGSRFGCPL